MEKGVIVDTNIVLGACIYVFQIAQISCWPSDISSNETLLMWFGFLCIQEDHGQLTVFMNGLGLPLFLILGECPQRVE